MNILVHTWWFSAEKGSEFSVAYNFEQQRNASYDSCVRDRYGRRARVLWRL